MPFPDAAAHLQVPGNPLFSKTDMLFYTSPVYFAAFFSMLHIPVSYHSTSNYIKNDSSQMFFRAELPVTSNDSAPRYHPVFPKYPVHRISATDHCDESHTEHHFYFFGLKQFRCAFEK